MKLNKFGNKINIKSTRRKEQDSSPLNSPSFIKKLFPSSTEVMNIPSQDKMTNDKKIVVPQICCLANHSMACNYTLGFWKCRIFFSYDVVFFFL